MPTAPRAGHSIILVATVFVAALVAGIAILLPISLSPDSGGSPVDRTVLVLSQPQTSAAGVSVGLIAALLLAVSRRAITSWAVALCGIGVIAVNHWFFTEGTVSAPLPTLNYLDAMGGGLLLAGITMGARPGRPQLIAGVTGGLAAVFVGGAVPAAHSITAVDRSVSAWVRGESPPAELIVAALVLVALSAFHDRGRRDPAEPSYSAPELPILSCAVTVWAATAGSYWVNNHNQSQVAIIAATAVQILAVVLAAVLLPARDGILILLVTAVAGVAQSAHAPIPDRWVVFPMAIGVVAGLLVALRWPSLRFAMMLVLATGVYVLLTHAAASSDRLHAAILAVDLPVLAGYCFGTGRVTFRPTWLLALSVVYLPWVPRILRDRRSAHILAQRPEPEHMWVLLGAPPTYSTAPALAGLAMAAGCGVAMIRLARRRS